jgi:hypothetical protein
MSGAIEGVALLEALVPKLRRMVDSGHRTLGGGTISHDGKSSTWGNEPIMKLANPDGPEIAAAIEIFIASLTTPPARSCADEDVARIIDPHAYRSVEDYLGYTAEWVERCSAAANNGFDYRAMARGLAEDNYNGAEHLRQIALAKAAAIRLLSQGEKA